eukprot:SAG31_NODE_6067_length_2185_cov_2.069990_3_plen_233_part_00
MSCTACLPAALCRCTLYCLSVGPSNVWIAGDELVCSGGMAVENFTAVTHWLRAAFGKSLLLYANECTGGLARMSAADLADLDLLSFTNLYDPNNQDGVEEVVAAKKVYNTSVLPKLSAHHKMLLAPGVYGNTPEGCLQYGNYTCTIEEQEIQVVKKLEAYFEWAVSDARVVGFNPWHFNYRTGDQYHPVDDMRIGAVQMPLVLAKLKEIGRYITNGPSNPWAMDRQHSPVPN